MESSDDDLAVLREAERARDELAADLVVPRGFDEWIGAAVAFQIATTAVALSVDAAWARAGLAAGLVVFGVAAGWQVRRFRRHNGAQVRGFVSRVVLGSATTASFGYAAALVAAYVAALRDLWWLVGPVAAGGGVVYVLSGRRWMRAYRREPDRLGPGESVLWLALVALVVVTGLVLLVLER